jgi:UDP-3-O-[3-hydroxymyristoyl] glucosamine N-acyltransferase
MVDKRFFETSPPLSLAEIASLTNATLSSEAAGNILVKGTAPLDAATASDLSFLDNVKYSDHFSKSLAGACFVRPKFTHLAPAGMALLITDQPYANFAIISAKLHPERVVTASIHPSATIAADVTIPNTATIAAGVVIESGVEIGEYANIGSNTTLYSGVTIGAHTRIGALCSISHAIIGKHCILHRGVHIGQDGFGFAPTPKGLIKVPQLGRVIIHDNVEIGSGTCIDRGAGPDTVIGMGTKIDNLVQIGHNVTIGNHCVIVAQCGIAGSVSIGDGTMLGGQVGVSGHLHIGSGARVAAQSGIISDIPAGAAYGGYPAVPVRDWHKQTVAVSKLIKSPPLKEEN